MSSTQKRILYLSFYFEPDLCAGSFRNSPLVKELARQAKNKAHIDVFTTLPNRYSSFEVEAPQFEERDNYSVHRIAIPKHESGMKDQVFSFQKYYAQVRKLTKHKKYDLVVASSSRLFTAYLGAKMAKKNKASLYLDIRDIFYDTLQDVLTNGVVKKLVLPIIKKIEKDTFNRADHINLISGGFQAYFKEYNRANYTTFPNGIDNIFIEANKDNVDDTNQNHSPKTIVYAGNIGEGQGLHKIVPQAAKRLENQVKFIIIGDGGAKKKLVDALDEYKVSNVELKPPVKRDQLITIYKNADFLFAHLNDYEAFEKVLPSKLFELATFNKPLIAGVGGFAANFVKENIENSILFEPCNVDQFVQLYQQYDYKLFSRNRFINRYKREIVNENMAKSMLAYV